jgi:hypothetical protein
MQHLKRYAMNPDNGWMTESQRGAWVRYADLTGAQPAPAAPSEPMKADALGMTQIPVRTLGRMHDRIAELEAKVRAASPEAAQPADSAMEVKKESSFACPICDNETPHDHPPEMLAERETVLAL